jgi:outer membrane murein-binding lipoprotein Lpp
MGDIEKLEAVIAKLRDIAGAKNDELKAFCNDVEVWEKLNTKADKLNAQADDLISRVDGLKERARALREEAQALREQAILLFKKLKRGVE